MKPEAPAQLMTAAFDAEPRLDTLVCDVNASCFDLAWMGARYQHRLIPK